MGKKNVHTSLPLYLTKSTYEYGKYKPEKYHIIHPGKIFGIGSMEILPYRVIHSIRCPALGFKLTTSSGRIIVYNPDVIDIEEKDTILADADYYVGDGSNIRTNLVRKRGEKLFGHAKVATQVNWCKKYGVSNIIFTHVGQDTIEHMEKFLKKNLEVVFAQDGMSMHVD